MNGTSIFLSGLGLTLFAAFVVVAYLMPHLKRILVDLCGTGDRASFWTAFSNVALILVPTIFAMHYRPGQGGDVPLVFEMSTQLEWALIGLVVTVITLGIVIGMFIPRRQAGS
jgi:ABC-type antimicrobial peptide transport system permease subunit